MYNLKYIKSNKNIRQYIEMSLKSVCINRPPVVKFPFFIVLSVNYK